MPGTAGRTPSSPARRRRLSPTGADERQALAPLDRFDRNVRIAALSYHRDRRIEQQEARHRAGSFAVASAHVLPRQIHERGIHVEPDAQAGVRPPHHFSEPLGEQAEHRLGKKNIGEPRSDRGGLIDRDLGAPATRAPTEDACAQLNTSTGYATVTPSVMRPAGDASIRTPIGPHWPVAWRVS